MVSSMAPPAMSRTSLQKSIEDGDFSHMSEAEFLHQVHDAFEPELERLKTAYPLPEGGGAKNLEHSPSMLLYGQNYDEINRTMVNCLALRWIINDQYDVFTRGHPGVVKLLRESFHWLRTYFSEHLTSASDVFALISAIVINDLGKDQNLEGDYLKETGKSVEGQNHDMVLFDAAKAGMVPALDRLDPPRRDDLMLGLELGSKFNPAQLSQAENVPGCLEGLLRMREHEHAFAMKYMELLLDVAGAAGHSDPTCAKAMIEPVFQGYKTVNAVSLDIISGNSTLRDGYDKVLSGRGSMLEQKGFQSLSVGIPEQRALLRLMTMGRTADKAQAELFYDAFYSLPSPIREDLVNGMSVDGHNDGTAVLPYYMPAMLAAGLGNVKNEPTAKKREALSSLMVFLMRAYDGTKPEPGSPGVVIEKDLKYAQKTITSEEFRKDPSVLDMLEIPKGEVLIRQQIST